MRREHRIGWTSPSKNRLATKSSKAWSVLPGNWDKINSQFIWESNNILGIPDLLDTPFEPKKLLYYGRWASFENAPRGSAVHFWMDDYRFEGLWNKPVLNLERLQTIGGVITPDFSIFKDWPNALNIWQVYRNRWMGRFWQQQGIKVIPSVSWNSEDSLDYCFLGIPKGSVVATETQCVRTEQGRETWREGFKVLLEVVEPSLVITYGSLARIGPGVPDWNIKEYPTFWDDRNKELQAKKLVE